VRRGEQRIDIPLEGLRIRVGRHPGDIGRISGQAGQDLACPPHEHGPRGLGGRLEPGRLKPAQHEAVDLAAAPGGLIHGRQGGPLGPMPAPVVGLASGDVKGFDPGFLAVVRPGQPTANPLLDGRDRRIGQLAVRGHLLVAVVPDHLDQQAGVGLAGHGDALGGEEVGPRVERQAALRIARLGGVAVAAVVDQQRPHPRLKKGQVVSGGGQWLTAARRRQQRQHRQPEQASATRVRQRGRRKVCHWASGPRLRRTITLV